MSDSRAQPSNEAAAPMNLRGTAAQWLPLDETARIIGAEYETLRLYARGTAGRAPLASRIVKGVLCARPGEAYAHLLRHSRCKNLVPPPGYGEAPAPAAAADPAPAGDDAGEHDLVDMLRRLIRDLERQAAGKISSDQLRAIAQAVQAAEKLLDRREKALLKFDPDQVVRMLKANAEAWCLSVRDNLAPVAAADVVKYVRETFGVDLVALNTDAVVFLTARIQAVGNNVTLPAVQKKLDDLCAGVRDLELGGPGK